MTTTQPNRDETRTLPGDHDPVMDKLFGLYRDLFYHDGYGTIRVEMRYLKRGQKEILLICGKEYRFVVDAPERQTT
ncbi:hypothetical protein [Desulfatiferula olefinivorans]